MKNNSTLAYIIRSLLCLLLSFSLFFSVKATEKTVYNPKPLADDLVLPMPHDAEMVFRPVVVPGANFWGETDRIVTLGNPQAGMFSALQKNMINGSFPSPDGKNWIIWIAKYELTKGQFVAMMGEDALAKYSGDVKDKNYKNLKGKELKKAQKTPLAWVNRSVITAFVRRYNHWLFNKKYPERTANLPKITGVPGFIRLPTEEEWEFAARGGINAIADKTFKEDFPFPENKLKKYAWFKKNAKKGKKPIGYKNANPLGIHGMYGNVQEMVGGIFRPEMTQGKPGGIPIRGGSFKSSKLETRAAIRREMDAYKWNKETKTMEEGRSFTIGTRLAIGSNVLPEMTYLTVIEADYEKYQKNIRQKTPVGQLNQNLAGQATAQLGNIDDALKQILEHYPDATREVNHIQQYMDKARGQLDQAQHKGARSLVQDATRNAVNIIELLQKAKQTQEALASSQSSLQNALEDEQTKGLSPEDSGSNTNRFYIKEFEKVLKKNRLSVQEQYKGYLGKITEIGQEYARKYHDSAFSVMSKRPLTQIEFRALALVKKHITAYNERQQLAKDAWWNDFQQVFTNYVQEYLQGESQ